MNNILLIPHIRVLNANALSSPFTIGFPAMTAWLGAVHALQRKLKEKGLEIKLGGIGVVCHQFNLQTYRGDNDFVSSIIGTANPLDKSGSRPAFIEEARCHLDVSLIVELPDLTPREEENLIALAFHTLQSGMKMAAGDIQGFKPLKIYAGEDLGHLKKHLMPGYALVERRDLMITAMEQGQDAIDAILDYVMVHHHCDQLEDGSIKWSSQRKETGMNGQKGWIVPIATGFHGISELGEAKNQRDPDTPHRFAESLVTLGEFKMSYRLDSWNELLWHYSYQEEKNLYLCQQTSSISEVDGF